MDKNHYEEVYVQVLIQVKKIIEGIAKQNGLDPIELPSLYEYIDPELLDQLAEGQEPAV